MFILLSFMEYLFQNLQSHRNIANYLAALRAYHIIHGLDTAPFKDEHMSLYLKSLKLQAPLAPSRHSPLDIHLLNKILQSCDMFRFPVIFNPLYLLCLFSFLWLSNILPYSVAAFDHTRQLARADYICTADGAVLLIKWSTTLQNRKDIVTISIPCLGDSSLCPIAALNRMIRLYPVSDNEPLFVIPRPQSLHPLTDSVARKHLKDISHHLGLASTLTFRDFRRAGASWSFQNGVSLEHIIKHGTWRSDAIWAYLSSSPTLESPVSPGHSRLLYIPRCYTWCLGEIITHSKPYF